MEVRELEYFLAVVDSGGFNRAFALHVSQPPLGPDMVFGGLPAATLTDTMCGHKRAGRWF
jgi:hypothetical protein